MIEAKVAYVKSLNTGDVELVNRSDILSSIMLFTAALLVGAVLVLLIISLTPRSKYLPPGPRPLPVLGNLLDLNLRDPVPELERVRCI